MVHQEVLLDIKNINYIKLDLFNEDIPDKLFDEIIVNALDQYVRLYYLSILDDSVNTVKNIKNANKEIPVMSSSTKFRSSFYSGWRNVMGIEKGIVRPYQLDVSDRDKAIIKSVKYADDGADELMVKPGMTSIDLIGPIKQITGKPCGAFQVSGEWLSITTPEQLLETYHVFDRAGADYMISYGARKLCNLKASKGDLN